MGMMGFYSNLLTKNKSLGKGFRGEIEDDMIRIYSEKKNEFNKLIDNKINEIKEEKFDKKKKEKLDEKENIINDIKNQTEEIKNKKNIENIENIELNVEKVNKVDEAKRRYLERKRNRPESENQTK